MARFIGRTTTGYKPAVMKKFRYPLAYNVAGYSAEKRGKRKVRLP